MGDGFQRHQLMRYFTKQELAAGMEWILTNKPAYKESRCKEGSSSYYEGMEPDKEALEISCEEDLSDAWQPEGMPRVSLMLDPEEGELIQVSCSCDEFRRDQFGCAHVAGTLAWYLMRRDGTDSFLDTPLEKYLAERTGVEHPLTPGILRRTDPALRSLLAEEKEERQSWLADTGEQKGRLGIECYLKAATGGAKLEVKLGVRRKYVIKDLFRLVKAYLTGGTYPLGKEEFRISPGTVDGQADRILGFLGGLWRQMEEERLYFSSARDITITGRDLDALMELFCQIPVHMETGQLLQMDPDRRALSATIDKTDYGAIFRMNPVRVLAQSIDWIYLYDEAEIFRLERREGEPLKEILDRLGTGEEQYIRQADIPAVCSRILAPLYRRQALTIQSRELQPYFPEVPKYQIYLDIPQDGMVSGTPYACYPSAEQKYLLFDQKTEPAKRNQEEERKTAERIRSYFNAFEEQTCSLFLEYDEEGLFTFLTDGISALSEIGDIYISDRLQRMRVRRPPKVTVGVTAGEESLIVSLKSKQMSLDELSEILSAYQRKKKYYRLKSGEFIDCRQADDKLWNALAELYRNDRHKNLEHLQAPLFRAIYLEEMLQVREQASLEGNERYRQLLKNMDSARENAYDIPDTLRETLRGYQAEGYRWICTLKDCGFCGVLADDMGLGKTLQVLTFLLAEKQRGKQGEALRTLIVTPASLVYNWQKEIETFTPQLSCAVISGTAESRRTILSQAGDADIWITSYDLLKRDIRFYEDVTFANEIIDEAQYIKNQATQAAKSVRLIHSGFRMALTGTPIENRLSELWSLFDYLMPGFLYTYPHFQREYEVPIAVHGDAEQMARLRSMIHPFILRRLKGDVLADLPEKLEETVTVRLSGEQKKLYEAHASRLKQYLDKQSDEEFRRSKLAILAELTKLRQLCCGPELFLQDYHGENAKKEACMELVRQAVGGGHKVLLFSQFTSALDIMGAELQAEGIPYHRIDGSVKKEERMRQVEAFSYDEVPVFCISLKAGGTGLNLTAADIVIHYDPWWNLAAQNQATDRAHRIGQAHTVTVYQLIAADTIEEQIQKLQRSKYELARDVLSGEAIQSIVIDKDEVLRLLQ